MKIETPTTWTGRQGWNLRLNLNIWKNIYCELPDPRFEEDICGAVLHSKKKMKQHIIWWHLNKETGRE